MSVRSDSDGSTRMGSERIIRVDSTDFSPGRLVSESELPQRVEDRVGSNHS